MSFKSSVLESEQKPVFAYVGGVRIWWCKSGVIRDQFFFLTQSTLQIWSNPPPKRSHKNSVYHPHSLEIECQFLHPGSLPGKAWWTDESEKCKEHSVIESCCSFSKQEVPCARHGSDSLAEGDLLPTTSKQLWVDLDLQWGYACRRCSAISENSACEWSKRHQSPLCLTHAWRQWLVIIMTLVISCLCSSFLKSPLPD